MARRILVFSSLLAAIAPRTVYVESTAQVDESLAVIGGGYAGYQSKSTGNCAWFGQSPKSCDGTCPAGYNFIRSSKTGNLTDSQGNRFLDPTFGSRCSTGAKYLCCRPDSSDCTWRGTWTDSLNRHWTCSYRMDGYTKEELASSHGFYSSCGVFRCAMMSTKKRTTFAVRTSGDGCTEFSMNGMSAEAYCGVIYFYKKKDDDMAVDRWFKM